MQLRTRIGLSVLPVLILIFAIGGAGWALDRALRRNQAEIDSLRDVEAELTEVQAGLDALGTLRGSLQGGTQALLLGQDVIDRRADSLRVAMGSVDRRLQEIGRADLRARFDRLRGALDPGMAGGQHDPEVAGRNAAALRLEVEQLRAAGCRDRDRIRRNAWISGVLGILSVAGMTLFVALYIFRSLRERLLEVRDAAEAIARGNFALRIAVREKDAIGQIGETFNRMAGTLAEKHEMLEQDVFVTRQLDDLGESLELADSEDEAIDLTLRALETLLHGQRHLVLLSDSSEAHLQLAGESAGERAYETCHPGRPFRCKAIRMARILRVEDPRALRACPHFDPQRGIEGYVCAPLTVVGKSVGTLQIVDEKGQGFSGNEQRILRAVSDKLSLRLGVLRLLRKTTVQAQTDVLTGLPNRRSFLDRVGFLHAQCERTGAPYAVILADLDHFKNLNDRHGHAAGDAALRLFAKNLARNARRGDLICRFGGEEFLVVLPDADATTAVRVAERLRAQTERASHSYDGAEFTASFGVATYPSCGTTFQGVLDRADKALYQAKDQGRNTVRLAEANAAEPGAGEVSLRELAESPGPGAVANVGEDSPSSPQASTSLPATSRGTAERRDGVLAQG